MIINFKLLPLLPLFTHHHPQQSEDTFILFDINLFTEHIHSLFIHVINIKHIAKLLWLPNITFPLIVINIPTNYPGKVILLSVLLIVIDYDR